MNTCEAGSPCPTCQELELSVSRLEPLVKDNSQSMWDSWELSHIFIIVSHSIETLTLSPCAKASSTLSLQMLSWASQLLESPE